MAELTRRNVLAAGTIGLAGVAVAGCSSGSDSGSTAENTPPAPSSTPVKPGEALVPTSDVPSGGGVIVPVAETAVVVTQPADGDFVGLSAVCPHQGCLVNKVEDGKIICPCHGSEFTITDGAVVRGPATTGLEPVAIEVSGDQVVLG